MPDEEEWTTLVDYLGGIYYAGGSLKEQGFYHWNSPNEGASNTYEFSALPGGYRTGLSSGSFRAMRYIGWWWTNTEYDLYWARNCVMTYDAIEVAKGRAYRFQPHTSYTGHHK